MDIVQDILTQMDNLSKPQAKFMTTLFSALLSCRGKANFLNLSRYADCSERTIRRNYRKPFNFTEFNHIIHLKTQTGPYLLGGDTSFITKNGKHTYGLGNFFHSSHHRPEKGLEVSLLALIDANKHTLALRADQTPPGDEESRMEFYLRQLHQSWPYWPEGLQ
jgi:hypothetical protein